MAKLKEIVDAYDVRNVSETYSGDVHITDLKEELGTKGHVLVVRGDKAYEDRLENTNLCNPKFWLYENLLGSNRVQEALQKNPGHRLFDGVGFSALEALGWHANNVGRKALAVMAHEMLPDKSVFDRYDIEVVHGDSPVEEGYVDKQREILKKHADIIPLHQALYGARSLAPIGNNVARQLEDMAVQPDATFWCIAGGSNLYGVGHKVKQSFPDAKTFVVEPESHATIPEGLALHDRSAVRSFSKDRLRNYSVKDWVASGRVLSGVWPLHAMHPNKYLLQAWSRTGDIGFDETIRVSTGGVVSTQNYVGSLNQDFNWTKTTALTLVPAIEMAKKGKNVLVMSYGRYRKHQCRDTVLES